MHVVIHTSLQSLSLVSLAKASCNVKLCNKLSPKLLDVMMKIAEYILCFRAEPSPVTSQMKTFRDTKESFISFWWLNCNAAMIMRAVFNVEKHWGCLLLMPLYLQMVDTMFSISCHLYCISNYLKSILLAPTSHQDWVPSLQSLIKCHFKNFQVGLVSLLKGLAWLELIFSLLK